MKESKQDEGYVVLCMLLLVVPCVAWQGYVMATLWNWFVFGYLTDLRLSILQAVGLHITLRYAVAQYSSNETTDAESSLIKMVSHAVVGAILLGAGFFLTQFM